MGAGIELWRLAERKADREKEKVQGGGQEGRCDRE